jgi:caffeoyl-CoA O-methyltransferase
MTEMTPERWAYTRDYLSSTFGTGDEHLNTLMDRATAAGIPSIAVSPDVGRLLTLLVRTTGGKRALELGTLAGYSAIWIARGLDEGGRLTTVELDEGHAAFAEEALAQAGVGDRVDVVRGAALDALDDVEGPLDFVFIDAVKTEYPAYFAKVRDHIAPGGLFVADNVLGAGSWWIDSEDNSSRAAVDELNRALAADPDFDAACVPLREGLLIARRK